MRGVSFGSRLKDAASRPLTLGAWAAILLGLAFIHLHMQQDPVLADGIRYRSMTVSLLQSGEFREPYLVSPTPQPGEVEHGYAHYFSPLWPAFMAPFYVAMGEPGFELAYLFACGIALVLSWYVARDLWGEAAGLASPAWLAVALAFVAVQRGSEPLALACWILMLWGIFRSLQPGREHWILLAGAASGLAYLTRASVGWLFILGGASGFLWRLRFHGKKAINRHYATAIAIFGVC